MMRLSNRRTYTGETRPLRENADGGSWIAHRKPEFKCRAGAALLQLIAGTLAMPSASGGRCDIVVETTMNDHRCAGFVLNKIAILAVAAWLIVGLSSAIFGAQPDPTRDDVIAAMKPFEGKASGPI